MSNNLCKTIVISWMFNRCSKRVFLNTHLHCRESNVWHDFLCWARRISSRAPHHCLTLPRFSYQVVGTWKTGELSLPWQHDEELDNGSNVPMPGWENLLSWLCRTAFFACSTFYCLWLPMCHPWNRIWSSWLGHRPQWHKLNHVEPALREKSKENRNLARYERPPQRSGVRVSEAALTNKLAAEQWRTPKSVSSWYLLLMTKWEKELQLHWKCP